MPGFHKIVFVGFLLAVSVWGASALAQTPEVAATPVRRSSTAAVSAEQLQAFADLTGDSPRAISLRLARDPSLAPMVVSAAEARRSRKTTGLVMTVVGFTILGVGDIVGSYIMLTTPGYPDINGHESQFYKGAAVAGGSLLVGLLLGIPGIVKMSAPSDEEAEALDYYSPSRASSGSAPRVAAMSPATVVVPLFSGTF